MKPMLCTDCFKNSECEDEDVSRHSEWLLKKLQGYEVSCSCCLEKSSIWKKEYESYKVKKR
jgi:hypothetical protein